MKNRQADHRLKPLFAVLMSDTFGESMVKKIGKINIFYNPLKQNGTFTPYISRGKVCVKNENLKTIRSTMLSAEQMIKSGYLKTGLDEE